jgi:hypothetical protein
VRARRLWRHRHIVHGGGLQLFGPTRFPGREAGGDYPIHIVVTHVRVTLMGVVDSDADKTLAGHLARGVLDSIALDNELVVEGTPVRPPTTSR